MEAVCLFGAEKKNISIRENVSISLVPFIFTFGRQKHFISLFTFFLSKLKQKKKRKNQAASFNKSLCAG